VLVVVRRMAMRGKQMLETGYLDLRIICGYTDRSKMIDQR